jgi:hypothetical protein
MCDVLLPPGVNPIAVIYTYIYIRIYIINEDSASLIAFYKAPHTLSVALSDFTV